MSQSIHIFSHPDRALLQRVKNSLDDAEIGSFIKNEFASGAIGEIPPQDSQPEIWLMDGTRLTQAEKIVQEIVAEPTAPDWVCASCQEPNDGAFELCWQCGNTP